MKLMQTNKGEFGYLKRERKRRIIIAAIMLGVPVFIFISMWIYLGTRNSIWTIIALVGSLPGCKAVVDVIMVYLALAYCLSYIRPGDAEYYISLFTLILNTLLMAGVLIADRLLARGIKKCHQELAARQSTAGDKAGPWIV